MQPYATKSSPRPLFAGYMRDGSRPASQMALQLIAEQVYSCVTGEGKDVSETTGGALKAVTAVLDQRGVRSFADSDADSSSTAERPQRKRAASLGEDASHQVLGDVIPAPTVPNLRVYLFRRELRMLSGDFEDVSDLSVLEIGVFWWRPPVWSSPTTWLYRSTGPGGSRR